MNQVSESYHRGGQTRNVFSNARLICVITPHEFFVAESAKPTRIGPKLNNTVHIFQQQRKILTIFAKIYLEQFQSMFAILYKSYMMHSITNRVCIIKSVSSPPMVQKFTISKRDNSTGYNRLFTYSFQPPCLSHTSCICHDRSSLKRQETLNRSPVV